MTTARVHLIAVGDELRSGRRQDTNGPWMARQLAEVGVDVEQLHIAGDEPEALAALLRHVAADATLVVLCGGLGPTGDDTTRHALARALDAELREHAGAWAQVEARLRSRGRVPNELQRTQALLPANSEPLENLVGTAPGIYARCGTATVVALPGVPIEMRALFEQHVLPRARGLGHDIPSRASCWVAGVPESDLARRVEALPESKRVTLAYYAHHGEIEVVAQSRGQEDTAAFLAAVRVALGADVFDPPPGGRIEHATVHALQVQGATVGVAESVTGGGIAQMLTSVPGASGVLAYGWVTYGNAAKTSQLGVSAQLLESQGAVSEAVACAMAQGARERAGATFGLATTGVAGPGDLDDAGRRVPAGRVHIALADDRAVRAVRLDGPRPRALVRRFACVRALDLLRRASEGAP